MARNEDTPENNDNLMEELLDKVKKMELEIAELRRLKDFPFLSDFNEFPDPNKCSDGGYHEYPFPWHSISPAACKKCGKLSESYPITFSDDGTGNPPWDFNLHGGNVMGNEKPITTHDSTKTNYIADTSRLF